LNAAALVRPGPAGGAVIIVAEASLPAVQALVRWDPATFARRELADRAELRFPPAVRMASLTGPEHAVLALLSAAGLPSDAEVLGPVPVTLADAGPAQADEPTAQFLVRTPRSAGSALALALRAGQAARSARKEPGTVRVQLDPAELV
jgi:primosomal protein N' (replication factor Y)